MVCPSCKAEVTPIGTGLNAAGVIILILAVMFCLPLVWLPFVLDFCKKKVCPSCGREMF